jgi:lipid-A-disaccharide synthase
VNSSSPLVYLIAGEPSGDLLAARLMKALTHLTDHSVRFAGIGGEAMRAEGLSSLFPQADLAVMGLAEVVPRIPKILRRLKETLADIEEKKPALIVTVDSWGFTGRVAKALKRQGSTVPRLHYVAPMVWAWKEKRARALAERVDALLCLLPNEPAYFERHGLKAVHVGHPVLERLGDKGDGAGFRRRHGIASAAPLLCVLPGSRSSETSRLLPVFAETAALMARRFPGLRVVVPSVETVAEEVRRAVAGWEVPAVVVDSCEKWDAFAASDAALAASGTVALELAVSSVPMVIAYRVAPLTAMLARRLLTIKYVCLLNLLVDRLVVPELLQESCVPADLADALSPLMRDGPERRLQLEGCAEALRVLGVDGESPSLRAAREAVSMIEIKSGMTK